MAFLVILGAIAAIVGVVALYSVVNGFVFSWLWYWFLVPLGLPVIGVAWSIGITLCITYLTYQPNTVKGDEDDTGKAIGWLIMKPLIALFSGWLVHTYFM